MFFSPEVFINLFLDSLLFFFLSIAWIVSIKISLWFDYNADTPRQYALLRQSYLAATIIKFALFFKIILLFYFIYTLDKLSNIIPGAMCAAGVITANSYGVWLFAVKIFNIYLFGIWLVINALDMKTIDYAYTKLKFRLFVLLYLFIVAELLLEYAYFHALDVNKIVSCCGVLFNPVGQSALGILSHIPLKLLLWLFYGNLVLLVVFYKRIYVFAFLSVTFIFIAILAIIFFFSPYIYELPTHHCPFCILQKEYFYIGYILYTLLFLGTFLGIAAGVKKALGVVSSVKLALLFDIVFTLILTYYVISYYLKNGVWLL
ncbi:hypothetical protein NitYY0826_C0547 [Nitratiruptor sp. YY08-26]|nr:hypothetical protein NitYY0813_C0545 [Nitratiruptor sp. YY08-13]BCD65621.1 hypothetical protein NitYY0826_C0547 [Nitratiruptor sp. YY08-26]